MKNAAVLIVCLAITLAAGSLSADDTSFRCGSDLITVGYTMYQVKSSCGAPDSEQVIGQMETAKLHPEVLGKTDVAINITEWIYARDGGLYVLTFEGDRLVKKEYRTN